MTAKPNPPPELAEVAPGWVAELAYCLVPHLTTWRLTDDAGAQRFAKVATSDRFPTLRSEAERMIWAVAYLPVPTIVTVAQVGSTTIMVTEALPGRDATDPLWHGDLAALVFALGRGLRRFHEAVSEEWCPFRFDVGRALDHVQRRIDGDDIDPNGFHDIHARLTPSGAFQLLWNTRPTDEDLVVCHGDYCAPNLLLEDGRVTGYVDLGELGVADRWWDIAVGAWSAGWNFGTERESDFYRGYGIEVDPDRVTFFRLLYDLVS